MHQHLSVRAYRPVERTHSHRFHQVVVPLHGVINISLDGLHGELCVGQVVVIKKNVQHSFSAIKEARFLVADIDELPDSDNFTTSSMAKLTSAFSSFCQFAEVQLESQSDIELQRGMMTVFKRFLALQNFHSKIDHRIARALALIESDISKDHSLAELAATSSLSISQFKVLFVKQVGMAAGKYILKLRMEQARVLLIDSDMPISIIANSVGYKDQSAFCRRFRAYYGVPPKLIRKL